MNVKLINKMPYDNQLDKKFCVLVESVVVIFNLIVIIAIVIGKETRGNVFEARYPDARVGTRYGMAYLVRAAHQRQNAVSAMCHCFHTLNPRKNEGG